MYLLSGNRTWIRALLPLTSVNEVTLHSKKERGIHQQTYYMWRRAYGGLRINVRNGASDEVPANPKQISHEYDKAHAEHQWNIHAIDDSSLFHDSQLFLGKIQFSIVLH